MKPFYKSQLKLLISLRNRYSSFGRIITPLISKNPLLDICLLVWILGIANCLTGFYFTWSLIIGSTSAFLFNFLIPKPRPKDIDERMKVLTSSMQGSMCVECVAVIIIITDLIIHNSSILLSFSLILFAIFIGFSRIVSNAYFPYQIANGYIYGFVFYVFSYILQPLLKPKRYNEYKQLGFLAIVVLIYLMIIMYLAESNDSNSLSVSYDEYLEVMQQIMNQDAPMQPNVDKNERVKEDGFYKTMKMLRERSRMNYDDK